MNTIQLYINGQLADLSDDSPVALTFQINNLADVKNQQGNTSNQFKLPLTQRNRQLLGFPDEIAFSTDLPYRQYQAKLVQDGLEIIPYGIGELNGIEQNNALFTILSGNVDFFDAIDGKLYDMGDSTSQWTSYGANLPWKPYEHAWTLDNVAASQLKIDGWIWPVVDYGAIDETIFSNPILIRYQRPGFFIKTAIDILLASAGYKGTGSLLNDPLYPLMICQFSNSAFEHGADYVNTVDDHGINVSQSQPQQLGGLPYQYSNPYSGILHFDTVNADPALQYSATSYNYTANVFNDVLITLTVPQATFSGYIDDGRFTLDLYQRAKGADPADDIHLASLAFDFDGHGEKKDGEPWSDPNGWTRLYGSNGSSRQGSIEIGKKTLSFETQLQQGDSVYVSYAFAGRRPASITLYPGYVLGIASQKQNVQPGQLIQCERIFPDISQKDLLKDTLQRFGIICQTDNAAKTISFNSFRDIVNNIPVAKDWTAKCLDQGKQVAFQLGNYAQVNYMQYKTDDTLSPQKLGWSQISIADQTLAASTTLFESQFAPSLNRPFYGGTIAKIEMIDKTADSMDFSVSVAPRILIDQKTTLNAGQQVTFKDDDGNTRIITDVISTPYFYKPDASELANGYGQASLLFQDLRTRYYPELEKILTQTKKVVRYIMLTPRDILELDLLIPVYLQQDGCYYYINKIDAWRKWHPVKVELVKLG